MKLGVIGLGMVGETVAFGLRRVGHEVIGFDIDPTKKSDSYDKILPTELVFICVPTPTRDFKCDITAVEIVLTRLAANGYKGLVVIKSTVPPGTTEAMAKRHNLRTAFCPEFLRERARFSDFVENHELCIIGTHKREDAFLIECAHGRLPKHIALMTPTEAELAKYFVNCFNAYRVNFANAFYDVCKQLGASYEAINQAVTKRLGIAPDYLTCNEQTREFGGACLPKDTQAFATFVHELGLYTSLFTQIVEENNRVGRGLVMYKDAFKESA